MPVLEELGQNLSNGEKILGSEKLQRESSLFLGGYFFQGFESPIKTLEKTPTQELSDFPAVEKWITAFKKGVKSGIIGFMHGDVEVQPFASGYKLYVSNVPEGADYRFEPNGTTQATIREPLANRTRSACQHTFGNLIELLDIYVVGAKKGIIKIPKIDLETIFGAKDEMSEVLHRLVIGKGDIIMHLGADKKVIITSGNEGSTMGLLEQQTQIFPFLG